MYTKSTQNLPLKIKWLKIGELGAIHLVPTDQKRDEEAGLYCPIGPLGTGLGPRAFRAPNFEPNKLHSQICLKYCMPTKVFALDHGVGLI